MTGYYFRTSLMPRIVAPLLRVTKYRFDTSWRHADSGFKAFVYNRLLCTFVANIEADLPGSIISNPYWHNKD